MRKSFEDILRDMKPGETVIYEPTPDLEQRTFDLAHRLLDLEGRVERVEEFLSETESPVLHEEPDLMKKANFLAERFLELEERVSLLEGPKRPKEEDPAYR